MFEGGLSGESEAVREAGKMLTNTALTSAGPPGSSGVGVAPQSVSLPEAGRLALCAPGSFTHCLHLDATSISGQAAPVGWGDPQELLAVSSHTQQLGLGASAGTRIWGAMPSNLDAQLLA